MKEHQRRSRKHETIKRAKHIFGTTKNVRRAGFILPDGEMLDFGPPLEPSLSKDLDHKFISEVYHKPGEIFPRTRGEEAIKRFMHETGAIRTLVAGNEVDLMFEREPNPTQLRVIRDTIEDINPRKVFVEKQTASVEQACHNTNETIENFNPKQTVGKINRAIKKILGGNAG